MSRIFASLEVIAHQGYSPLAKEIVAAVEELQKLKEVGVKDIERVDISGIIRRHTGLLSSIILDEVIEMYTSMPPVTKNNIFVEEWMRDWTDDVSAMHAIVDHGRLSGTIDLERSRVTGDFAKIYNEIHVGQELLNKNSPFTPGEVAGMFLHEIGHIFIVYEMSSRFTRTNFLLEAGMKKMLNCETQEQRIQVLSYLENLFDEKVDDVERITAVKKEKDYYRTVFLTLAVRESQSQLGYNVYDMRACEQLADQFASRHGMGRDLVTALDKVHRWYDDRAYWGSFQQGFMFVLELLTFIPISVVTFGLPFILLTYINHSSYDPIPRRLEKFKLDIHNALKDRNLSKKERDRIMIDLTIVENTLKEVKDNPSFYEFIWNKVIPFGRSERKEIVFNEELERMLNNSLFGASAALR